MEITKCGNQISIIGNIKTLSDYQKIKSAMDSIATSNSNITIEIVDSLSITSSVIGYFNKLVLKDNITINLRVGNAQLMELLDDLDLTSLFNAKKM